MALGSALARGALAAAFLAWSAAASAATVLWLQGGPVGNAVYSAPTATFDAT